MLELFFAYTAGTLVGLWLTRQQASIVIDSTIEALIDQHFIKTRIDQDGNTEIVKWNEE